MPKSVVALFSVLVFAVHPLASPGHAGEAVPAPGENAGESGIRFRAVLMPLREATLAAEIAAPVKAIRCGFGAAFREGDTLLEFDDRLPAAQCEAARSGVASALVAAEAVEQMHQKSQASKIERERTRDELAKARFALVRAEYELASAKVTAPFAGRVSQLLVNEHELIERGRPLMAVVDDSVLRVRFLVPEDRFREIRLGDRIRVAIPALDLTTDAVLSQVGATIEPASRTVEVRADLDNRDGLLRSGMTGLVAWPPSRPHPDVP